MVSKYFDEYFMCPTCEHKVYSERDDVQPIRWSDGHVCNFVKTYEGKEIIDKQEETSKAEQQSIDDSI